MSATPMKRLAVVGLETLAVPFLRHGWTYPLGNWLALRSCDLDVRWGVGHWKER